jgi:hypothetical protein
VEGIGEGAELLQPYQRGHLLDMPPTLSPHQQYHNRHVHFSLQAKKGKEKKEEEVWKW